MLLNSQQIIERGLITNIGSEEQIQQVGIDLRVKDIKKINGGSIYQDDKKILPFKEFKPIIEKQEDGSEKEFWLLSNSQSYSVTFYEECKIPNNAVGFVIHRSTVMRMSGTMTSAIYDCGYYSVGGISCMLTVTEDIKIEKGSRLAQMYFQECYPVPNDKLYNGSYQGEKNIK